MNISTSLKNLSRKAKLWIIIGSAAVLLVVLSMAFSKGEPVRTASVQRATVRSWVEDIAKTTLPHVYKITMPVKGRIKPIIFQEGDNVFQGQVVAEMDPKELETRLADTRAQLALNRDKELEATALRELVRWTQAMNDVTKAAYELIISGKAQVRYSEWWLEANKELLERGAISENNYRQALLTNAESEVTLANQKLIANAVNSFKIATELGPVYVKNWLDRKALQTRALEKAVITAEDNLKKAVMHSPVNGVILKRYVKNERVLDAGAKLLDIGLLDTLEVTANILTQEAGQIRVGNKVALLGQVFGSLNISGTVTRVDPEAFTKVSSLGVDQQRIPIKIAFESGAFERLRQANRHLGLGYRLRVRIFTDEQQNALSIPRMALFRDEHENWRTFVVRKGKAELITVTPGIMNENTAQILKGLEEFDQVVVSPPKSLVSGTKVDAQPISEKASGS